jgi:hypothetical protein
VAKKRYECYIGDWTDPKVIKWLQIQFEKHPEIQCGEPITGELAQALKETGKEMKSFPGKPKPSSDWSSWKKFLPDDWEAWLCYYELRKQLDSISIRDIVYLLTERYGEPLSPSNVFKENDEYQKACFIVKSEFKAARDRISELKL